MGEDHQSPPSSRRKHQRLSDEASDDDHKRRKRHHHRHHRPHHHHSKHERNRDEQEGEVIVIEKILKHSSQMKLADDEREEGEIFEEEEEEEGGWERPAFAMEDVSEVESGEIKMDDATTVPIKEPSLDEDLLQEHQLDNLSTGNDLGILNCRDKENDRDGETLFESTRDNPNDTAEYGYLAEGETRNNFEHHEGSRSSVSEESAYKSKHIDMDDHLSRYSECISEKEEVNEKRRSINNSRSTYPRSSEEKPFEAMQLSLSEAGNRDQTAADDYTTGGRLYLQVRDVDAENCIQRSHSERLNKERNNSDFERIHKHGKLDKYTNRNQNVDNEFHEEREGSLYDNHDLHDYRHRSRDRGREVLDRRHGSKDRHMEVEKCNNAYKDSYRNKSHNSSEFIEHVDRNESRYRDRDRFEGQYGEEDRCRETEKYRRRVRERVKDRDLCRDRSRERRRVRNAKGEGDRERERERDNNDRDKSRIGDRKTNSLNERERVNQRDRDRRGKHDLQTDYRLSKHEDTDYRKERIKTRSDVINSHVLEESKQNSLREEEEKDYQGRIEQQLAKQDEENIEKIKEESRKRRQAILEKYKQRQNQHLKPPPNFHGKELFSMKSEVLQQVPQKIVGVSSIEELVEHYDNSDAHIVDPSFIVGKSPIQNGFSVPVNSGFTCALGEGSPKSERSTDMFCDDIFGDSPAGVRKVGKDDIMKVDGNGLHDNWDDAEGYYSYRLGEVLDGRYEVIAAHGKGVFSTVVRAKDLKGGKSDPEEVAIKIIRSNDTMYKAGMEELVILKKLAGADPEDKRHCVRFLSSFKYRNHLCLVFESLNMNLREVLKKFGRNIGLRLTAVRAYAKQLFIALKHLRNCGVLHCDIKPDNMLVNEAKNVLKLCDFGNAMFAGKNDVTPYLVSRFYRAPEIILGLTYDHPLDIWSVGCCLFELYTGKVLFPGPSNNDMLRLHMELKGPFPKKMLRKGAFIDQHFDQDLNFHATEDDPVTKKTVKRMLLNIKPKDIGTLISGSPGEDPKMLANFKDLLDRIFVLDPEKRITVSQALSHPFITGK